ncbi:MAG: SH3 domain-containing protein [Sulfitobacter sp.]
MKIAVGVVAVLLALPAGAEQAVYGHVDLTGLGRNDWPLNPSFASHNTMVCNVNGPDGFLSIRSGPGSDFKAVRKLNRLAIIEVDDDERRGHWVRVVNAYRTVSPQGYDVPFKALPVQGWAHDGYLCSFIH